MEDVDFYLNINKQKKGIELKLKFFFLHCFYMMNKMNDLLDELYNIMEWLNLFGRIDQF